MQENTWERVGDGQRYTALSLAQRLIDIGARADARLTLDELLTVPVGGCIKTGVSSYGRIS